MYTSGCPKNQNKCWYKTGSPPPLESKNVVLRLRSVNNIVMAPANTGRDNNNKIAVKITDHGNNGILSLFWRNDRIFKIVVIKLAAPKIDLAPARCNEKIVKSTDGPLCAIAPDKGG